VQSFAGGAAALSHLAAQHIRHRWIDPHTEQRGNSYIAAGIRFERGESMQFRFLFAMVMAFALSLGAIAQQQDDSGIKQDTKDAAHSTGKAVKKTGHKIKKGTKKVVHKSANATRKGAEKVEDKSAPTPTPPPQQ
jgi:hypothetical protein